MWEDVGGPFKYLQACEGTEHLMLVEDDSGIVFVFVQNAPTSLLYHHHPLEAISDAQDFAIWHSIACKLVDQT